jgi:hypothetical protein
MGVLSLWNYWEWATEEDDAIAILEPYQIEVWLNHPRMKTNNSIFFAENKRLRNNKFL